MGKQAKDEKDLIMNDAQAAKELVAAAKELSAKDPERYFTLDNKGKWTLMDQGQPVNTPRDLETVQKLAKRHGWKIDKVWVSAKGKFVPLSKVAAAKELTADFGPFADNEPVDQKVVREFRRYVSGLKDLMKDLNEKADIFEDMADGKTVSTGPTQEYLGYLKGYGADLFKVAKKWDRAGNMS